MVRCQSFYPGRVLDCWLLGQHVICFGMLVRCCSDRSVMTHEPFIHNTTYSPWIGQKHKDDYPSSRACITMPLYIEKINVHSGTSVHFKGPLEHKDFIRNHSVSAGIGFHVPSRAWLILLLGFTCGPSPKVQGANWKFSKYTKLWTNNIMASNFTRI